MSLNPARMMREAGPLGVLAFALALVALFVALTRADVPITRDLTGTETEIVAPASAGLARAIDICNFGVVNRQPTQDASGFAYTAIFGAEVMRWVDSPPGGNPLAVVNGETVVLSEEVMRCLRERF